MILGAFYYNLGKFNFIKAMECDEIPGIILPRHAVAHVGKISGRAFSLNQVLSTWIKRVELYRI